MPNWPILALGLLLLLLGLLALRRALALRRIVAQVRRLAPRPVGELQPGLVRTTGRLAADAPVAAPLTGRPSAYVMVKAENRPPPGAPTRRLATFKQWVPSRIATDAHAVDLEPWTAQVASAHRTTVDFDALQRVPEDRQELFEVLGMSHRHVGRLRNVRITEYRFEPGDTVHVTGTYDPKKGIYRLKRNPFVVSAFEDLAFLQGYRNELLLFSALPPMLMAAGAVIALLAFA